MVHCRQVQFNTVEIEYLVLRLKYGLSFFLQRISLIPAETSLHFIGNPENIVLCAKLPHPLEVTRVWNEHPRLPLDGLNHEGCCVWILQLLLQGCQVVVGNRDEARHERSIVIVG